MKTLFCCLLASALLIAAPQAPPAPPQAAPPNSTTTPPAPPTSDLDKLQAQLAKAEKTLRDWPNLSRYGDENAKLAPPSANEARVVFMGDSITDGWGRSHGTFFPGKPYVNRGIGGQTTPQMVLRFRPDVIDLKPRVVVILAGTNDIAGNTGPATLSQIEENLATMTELAQAHDIRVILSSLTPVCDYLKPQTTRRPPDQIIALNKWIKDYCAAKGLIYLDYYSALLDDHNMLKKELTYDGLHPNDAGYEVMSPLAAQAVAAGPCQIGPKFIVSSFSSDASIATATPDRASIYSLPLLFGVTILSSSCLLFLVQPLASKLILPWFGGSASVWIACMLFFQMGLLAGYLYAHILSRNFNAKHQAIIHIALLLLSLAVLPILPNPTWQPKPGDDPTWRVFAVLATSVGLPYVLLSSSSPLVQSWFSVRRIGALPYRYFALSNAGSLLALLAYPVFVEPNFNGHQQAWIWSGAFMLFALLCITAAIATTRGIPPLAIEQAPAKPLTRLPAVTVILWLALAACASTLLLTVTNLLTQNIAPMPLLWVVPLSIYLLTFILCFESDRWYRRIVFIPLLLPALWCLGSAVGTLEDEKIKIMVPLLVTALFIACMVCHGELVRLKPASSQLTAFYLSLAAGGAIGGLFVALFAPHVFRGMFEYPISYLFCAVLALFVFLA